ncbi:MAG: hypothetical protein ACREBA_02450 [Nitrosotalea sp.]
MQGSVAGGHGGRYGKTGTKDNTIAITKIMRYTNFLFMTITNGVD